MALSNMKNEPRREIIESVMGILLFGSFLLCDFLLSRWIVSFDRKAPHDGGDIFICMFLVPIAGFLGWIILYGLALLTHSLGEDILAFIAKLGWDPRPVTRFNRYKVGQRDPNHPNYDNSRRS